MKKLCVFCGSLSGVNKEVEVCVDLVAKTAADHSIELVCGGSNSGLMKLLIESSVKYGGQIMGIHPRSLNHHQPPHSGLSRVIHTQSLHDRKEKMIEISDAFLVLPGAYGTFDEWLEVLVLKKIDAIKKPIFVHSPQGFWDHAFKQFEVMESQGFVQSHTRKDLLVSEVKEVLADQIISKLGSKKVLVD